MCCQGSLARLRMADLDGAVRQAVVTVFARGPFFAHHVPDDHADICAWMRRHVWAGTRVSINTMSSMGAANFLMLKEGGRTLAASSGIGRRRASLWRQMGAASMSHTSRAVPRFSKIRSQRPRWVWCVVPPRSSCLRCTRVGEAAGMCGAGHCVGTLAVDMLRTACMCGERSTGALVAKSVPLTCRMIMTFFRKVRRAVDDRPTHR